MKSKSTMIVLATIFSCSLALLAQMPQIVTYQGRLQAGGTNFNGTGRFKFAIVNQGTNAARQAAATANVVSGFIVSYTVTSGGYGYTTVPDVMISDPTGSGAVGIAQISGGVVTNIHSQNAGSGYSSTPTVTIASPSASMAYVTYWSHDGTSVDGSEPATAVPVPVNQGLFAVGLGDVTFSNMIPLPASVFANPNPALRIWFSDGVGSVQQLSPDQAFTAAAFAMMADTASNLSGTIPPTGLSGTYGGSVSFTNAGNSFSGDGSSLANLNASALTSGTVPSTRVSGTYGNTVNFSSAGNSFTGNGGGLTSLNANNLASGTVADARLSAKVDLLNAAQIFTVTKTFNMAPSFAAGGGAPFTVSSGMMVANLNADMLDGNHSAAFALSSHTHAATDIASGTLDDARLSANVAMLAGLQSFSGVKTFNAAPSFTAVGAPFSVGSTSLVNNLNADRLDGYQASNATNSIPINNGTVNTGLNADTVDGVHGGSILQIRASGVVSAGSTLVLAIPHYTIFTLQLSSGWPYSDGLAFVEGCENDGQLGVTYTKYNGDGTSAVGGSTTLCTTTNTVLQFGTSGIGNGTNSVSCNGDSYGGPYHVVLHSTPYLELLYRLIY